MKENVVIGHVKIEAGHFQVVVGVELHGPKTEPGLGVVPVDFPDIIMPVVQGSRQVKTIDSQQKAT